MNESLVDAVAAAMAEQRETLTNAHFVDLRAIAGIWDAVDERYTMQDIGAACDAMARLARERMAALTGGPTEKNL